MLGVDIGNRSIKICEIQTGDPTPLVTKFGYAALDEGIVSSAGWADPEGLPPRLKEALRAAGSGPGDALLCLPVTELAVYGRLRLAGSSGQEVCAGALWPTIDSLVPFPVDDNNTALLFAPTSEGPPQVDVAFLAIPRATLDAFEYVSRQAGLSPVGATVDGLAWSAWLSAAGVQDCVIPVHVGSCTTTVLAIARGSVLGLRWIAAGSDDVTRALADRLSIPRAQAEALKRRGRTAASGKDAGYRDEEAAQQVRVSQILEETADQLAAEIEKAARASLEGTAWSASRPRMVLAGGGAGLEELTLAIQRRWEGVVSPGTDLTGVRFGESVNSDWLQSHRLGLGPVLGLALGTAPVIPLGRTRKALPAWQRRRVPVSGPATPDAPIPPLAQRHRQTQSIVLTLAAVYCAAMLLGAGVLAFTYREQRAYEQSTDTAIGVVIDHQWHRPKNKKASSSCCEVVEYDARGRTNRFVEDGCASFCEHEKGSRVEVLYRRTDPSDARLKKDVTILPFLAGVLGVLGIGGAVGGVIVYGRRKRRVGEDTAS